ncbi:DNA adenine methylase, partial [Metamycoplasma equirhinis]|uniref:DNA adenine methylase n=1 Tax=Metamycoplasma equirhinis TaxID=92402 RepID=UPI0035946E94
MPEILKLFPSEIDKFIDVFSGGGTIFGYINSKEYILNDINSHLISLIKLFYNNDALKIINDI